MDSRQRDLMRSLLPHTLAVECKRVSPQFGKTAFVKLVYLLQELHQVPLGYRFTLYSYGPYCKDVLADLERAQVNGWVDINFEEKEAGFKIEPRNLEKEAPVFNQVVKEYWSQIRELVNEFGALTARELELRTTIVYLSKTLSCAGGGRSRWDHIANAVQQLKPQFDIPEIRAAARELEHIGEE